MPRVVLASRSPYRKRLLERLGIAFDVAAPHVDEAPLQNDASLTPREVAVRLALAKAKAVASGHSDAIVIGSDQVAVLDGQILTKPETRENNISQLASLSGRTHELITAVSIVGPGQSCEFVNEVRLTIRELTLGEICRYVDHDQPWDCAGGYRIEGRGIALFTRVETTDPSSIEGLPLMELTTILREFGVQIP